MAKSKKRHLHFFFKTYKVSSVNKSSLEERPIVSFRGYQLIIYGCYIIFILLCVGFLLTAYSPVKNLLPQNVTLQKRGLIELIIAVDSLKEDLNIKSQYVSAINRVISGEVLDSVITVNPDSSIAFDDLVLEPSKEDSALRKMVENEDLYNIPTSYEPSSSSLEELVFFKPVEGVVTDWFNVSEKHFGVDVVSNANASVKATLDGVVVFSDWSVASGYTILIQHSENIISVYMHNSSLTKENNSFVKAGEVIGVVGNSGESSLGPHLHFELWQNGSPVNPLDYIDF